MTSWAIPKDMDLETMQSSYVGAILSNVTPQLHQQPSTSNIRRTSWWWICTNSKNRSCIFHENIFEGGLQTSIHTTGYICMTGVTSIQHTSHVDPFPKLPIITREPLWSTWCAHSLNSYLPRLSTTPNSILANSTPVALSSNLQSTLSPGFTGPTPDGVPVRIISPGWKKVQQ